MISEASKVAAQKARTIYQSGLRQQLEPQFADQYICIEPVSGTHFIGETFDEAVNAALDAFPDRLTTRFELGIPLRCISECSCSERKCR